MEQATPVSQKIDVYWADSSGRRNTGLLMDETLKRCEQVSFSLLCSFPGWA